MNKKAGFTMVELVFGVAFIILMAVAVFDFQKSIFSSGDYLQQSFMAEGDARAILRSLVSEIRAMNYSGVGSYPIASASSDSLVFFSDVDGDGLPERLRYFVEGNVLKKGIVYPTGSPASYNLDLEKSVIVVRGLAPSAQIFSFYDTNYDGTGLMLPSPINIPDIRLVKIDIPIALKNKDVTVPYHVSSQVSIRNLKENL